MYFDVKTHTHTHTQKKNTKKKTLQAPYIIQKRLTGTVCFYTQCNKMFTRHIVCSTCVLVRVIYIMQLKVH